MPLALSTCPLALGCATDTYFHNYAPFIAEVLECTTSELSTQVYNYAIGEAKAMYNLIKELDRLL
jgi:hypothetical protein